MRAKWHFCWRAENPNIFIIFSQRYTFENQNLESKSPTEILFSSLNSLHYPERSIGIHQAPSDNQSSSFPANWADRAMIAQDEWWSCRNLADGAGSTLISCKRKQHGYSLLSCDWIPREKQQKMCWVVKLNEQVHYPLNISQFLQEQSLLYSLV